MAEKIRAAWDRLSRPKLGAGLKASQVAGTNCWLFKDHQGALGFLLSGVHPPSSPPDLLHFEILEVPEKRVHQGGEIHSLMKCLEIHLDPSCDAEILTMVLDRMADHEPSGRYTSELLFTVLNHVIHLVRRPKRPPSKEDVIGVWGELKILQLALAKADSYSERKRRIAGWEAEGAARDIIDFRYPHLSGGIAIEVKTSVAGRTHHINSMDQVTLPDGFEEGWLASISIRETDGTSGKNCADLVERIESMFDGLEEEVAELTRTLHSKLDMRGICCHDERFSFVLPDDGIRLIEMRFVPRPRITPEIQNVEWEVNLESVEYETGHQLIS